MKILAIHSSARVDGSQSTRVAQDIVAKLQQRHPQAEVTVRDLARNPHPVLDEAALGALFTPPEQRSAEQAARVALDDALIAELKAHDVIVLGVPMYNFGVPAQLKNWIDAVARAQVTFRYTENGPQGLVTGKTVYVALARGGRYRDTAADTQVPYLRMVLGFLGMTDVRFVYAEGFAMGPDAAQQALREAAEQIDTVVA
ncbi:FMN-dependent NADH-azoreductase [Caldimonas tepidiphila]|uniref:FMN-dependent NADH-azoreductase n=1 Tax=Caldimonas tepidiphila TaxID=2315841 RepID=UPI000E5B35C0|nr:NAD(P)H-dependent oxidoreductase [Caldimonas tepidiphila]